MKEHQTLPINPNAPIAVASGDLFSDFVDWLKRNKARLRPACKMTVDTDTLKTTSLPSIEVMIAAFSHKFLPLKMTDGRWYFDSVEERDAMYKRIIKSLNIVLDDTPANPK